MLCVEGLSHALNVKVDSGDIHGCRISTPGPAITHLLFVDDSFLFFKANMGETQTVKMLLNEYKAQSGQAVNYRKLGIFFSSNVRRDKQTQISSILGVQNEFKDSKYLGLPSLIGRSKKKVFSFIKD